MKPEKTAQQAPESLRERKKRETREKIAGVSLRLFERNGFHGTTIAQIAEAADVAPRTVSSYFPVKEELAFPDQAEAIASLREALSDRAPDVPALVALRGWLESALSRWGSDADEVALRRRVIDAEPDLRAYELRAVDEMVDTLRREIARDLGRGEQDLEPRMAAAATVAVFEVLGDHFKQCTDSGSEEDLERSRSELGRFFDHAVRFVEAGVEALQRSSG